MGRVSAAQAAQNRERIVATAARLFRERGIAGISVADVMAEAGLTHGGFYKHFPSKDALAAEAVTRAFADQAAALAGPGPATGGTAGAKSVGGTGGVKGTDETRGTNRNNGTTGTAGRGGYEGATGNGETAGTVSKSGNGDATGSGGVGGGRAGLLDRYLSAAHRDEPGTGCPTAGFGGDVARAVGGDATRWAYAKGVEGFARALGPDGEPDLAALSTMVGALILARATAGTALSDRILDAARITLGAPVRASPAGDAGVSRGAGPVAAATAPSPAAGSPPG